MEHPFGSITKRETKKNTVGIYSCVSSIIYSCVCLVQGFSYIFSDFSFMSRIFCTCFQVIYGIIPNFAHTVVQFLFSVFPIWHLWNEVLCSFALFFFFLAGEENNLVLFLFTLPKNLVVFFSWGPALFTIITISGIWVSSDEFQIVIIFWAELYSSTSHLWVFFPYCFTFLSQIMDCFVGLCRIPLNSSVSFLNSKNSVMTWIC